MRSVLHGLVAVVIAALCGCSAQTDSEDSESADNAFTSANNLAGDYIFSSDIQLGLLGLGQKGKLTGSFSIGPTTPNARDGQLQDVKFEIELLPERSLEGYTLASSENVSAYFSRDNSGTLQFVIEHAIALKPEAAKSGLGKGTGQVVAQLYPFCDATLARCDIGALSGIETISEYHGSVPSVRFAPLRTPFVVRRVR